MHCKLSCFALSTIVAFFWDPSNPSASWWLPAESCRGNWWQSHLVAMMFRQECHIVCTPQEGIPCYSLIWKENITDFFCKDWLKNKEFLSNQRLLFINILRPRQMAAILYCHFATTFSDSFSWMKTVVFCFEFHWNLLPMAQITIQHWFR